MKKNIILIALLALASCQQEEPMLQQQPATITATIPNSSPTSPLQGGDARRAEGAGEVAEGRRGLEDARSRAEGDEVVKTTFATGDVISITHTIRNTSYTASAEYQGGTTWTTTPDPLYIDLDNTAGITATYTKAEPVTAAEANQYGYTVTTYYDNLTAQNSGTPGSPELVFAFTHAGALLTVVTNGTPGRPADYDYLYIIGKPGGSGAVETLAPDAAGQCILPAGFVITEVHLRKTGLTDPYVRTPQAESGGTLTTRAGETYTLNLAATVDPIALTITHDELPAWNNHAPERMQNTATLHYIYDKEDLFDFAQAVNGTYPIEPNLTLNALQMADIDLEEELWTPIGTEYSYPYKGTYNGNGYTIAGLKVEADIQYAGLFGYTDGATLVNIHLVEASVTTRHTGGYAGALVGGAGNGTTIALCSSTGTVSGGQYVGGLVGSTSNAHITRSLSTCTVTAAVVDMASAGGLTGYSSGITVIAACMAGGAVSIAGTANYTQAGGFIGENYEGTITHCYATGTASGATYTGGFVGLNNNEATIAYSYTTQGSFRGNTGSTLTATWSAADAGNPVDVVRADVTTPTVRTWINGQVKEVTFNGLDIWTADNYPTIKYNNHGTIAPNP